MDGKIKKRRRPRESGDIGAKSLCWAGWKVSRREDWQKVVQHVDPVGETAKWKWGDGHAYLIMILVYFCACFCALILLFSLTDDLL